MDSSSQGISLFNHSGFWYIFEDAEHEVGFTQLAKSAIHLLKRAKEFNDRGDYFPVYGIQSGM